MKTKYKKLVVAIQSAMITSLVCSAIPSYASDVELYKSPQASQTTIMFMVDVSGSMDSENRIENLKAGMTKLLLGDATKGVEPLPDKLVVGLSEFSGGGSSSSGTGRIKIEAKALGESTALGIKEVYRVLTSATYSGERTQTQTRYGEGYRTRNSGSVDFGPWQNYWLTNYGNDQYTSPTLTNRVMGTNKQVQECIEWNNPGSLTDQSCKTWMNSSKSIGDLNNLGSPIETDSYSFSRWANASDWGEKSIQFDRSECTKISGGKSKYCSEQTQYFHQERTGTQTSTTAGNYIQTYTGSAYDTHRKKMLRGVNLLSAGGGTPTAYAYAEVGAYVLGKTTKGQWGNGFSASVGNSYIQDGNNYIAPSSINRSKQCNTQGIYFLTDGDPTYYNNYGEAYDSLMKFTLGSNGSSFNCSANHLLSTGNSWGCIGNYTKALLDPTKNPAGVSVKTAVVGFGSSFNDGVTGNSNVENAKKWGELGGGGWYSGNDDVAVINSVKAFLKKLQKYIPPVTTGSVTVPVDNLDTQNIQPWGYFPQFDPQPDSKVTTWIGNLKKYQVINNVLRDRDGNKVVDDATGLSVDDPNDYWADTSIKKTITKVKYVNGAEVEEDLQVRIGGALSQFKLGLNGTSERKIYTDRKIVVNGSAVTTSSVSNENNLAQILSADLKVLNPNNNYAKDIKRGYIAALFGYNVSSAMAAALTTDNTDTAQTNFANFLVNSNATLRQMGAVMHSKPILITQSGTTTYNDTTGDLTYTDRDDLIVFGTTQGLLHVVQAGKDSSDSNAGKEVFTFVPNEMIDNQYQGFLDQKDQGSTLMYGIDGQWTAYTEYVTKKGTKPTEPVVTVKDGKQWLYGGLRMGGRSYYALDLSNVTSSSGTPKLKFRINPEAATAYSPLSYMGQSWSKPTIAWVNWQGTRRLVMLVGGGYDSAYESLSFRPSSSIDKGAGVYMFDANDGSLLWWSSANVSSSSSSKTETYTANMKRSVVSQIKAIDRNNDGLADHLYFGDLGGQVWRVDLNDSSKAGNTENLAKRVVRIMDMSSASNVPRFYSTPTFTIHNSVNGLFGVVTIGSGNLSFPMSESDQNDALYVIYDKDVTKRNLSVLQNSELSTVDNSPTGLNGKKLFENTNGNTLTALSAGGWYVPLGSKYRILNDNVAIDNDLYTSVFNANVDITDVDCYGGVRGKSIAKQYCLPYGQCFKTDSSGNNVPTNRPDDIELGKGNIGISFGGIDKKRGLVLNLPTDKTLKSYQGKTKFISQRWYER